MTGKEIYKIWAPAQAKWVDWVRPVPFIPINDKLNILSVFEFSTNNLYYVDNLPKKSAIIVDLSECESIKEGVALTEYGFRPIPVYNGTIEQQGSMSTTNNKIICQGLIWGGFKLKDLNIPNDAPPAFLLDSDRLNRLKINASVFDNSWDIYDQDLPSGEYFLKNGIENIVVRADKINRDLKKILFKYQKLGIKIYFTNGYENPKLQKIRGVKNDKI